MFKDQPLGESSSHEGLVFILAPDNIGLCCYLPIDLPPSREEKGKQRRKKPFYLWTSLFIDVFSETKLKHAGLCEIWKSVYALILRQVWRTFCFLEDGLNLNKDTIVMLIFNVEPLLCLVKEWSVIGAYCKFNSYQFEKRGERKINQYFVYFGSYWQ